MNLLVIISSMLIAKSLPMPQAGNCFKSNHNIYKNVSFDVINSILANTTERKQFFVDSAYNKCGIKISFNNTSDYINIHHGAIPRAECKLPNSICNINNIGCNKAVSCCKKPALLVGYLCNEKYKLEKLSINSTAYKERIKNCNITSNVTIQCYQIIKLPKYNIKTTTEAITDTTTVVNNNTSIQPTNSEQNLYMTIYIYILPLLYAIRNL